MSDDLEQERITDREIVVVARILEHGKLSMLSFSGDKNVKSYYRDNYPEAVGRDLPFLSTCQEVLECMERSIPHRVQIDISAVKAFAEYVTIQQPRLLH